MAHILLAEDDESLRKFLAAALVKAGHAVTDFGDGSEAYECIKGFTFDLLLTDIVMPGMDGIELAKRAAGTERRPQDHVHHRLRRRGRCTPIPKHPRTPRSCPSPFTYAKSCEVEKMVAAAATPFFPSPARIACGARKGIRRARRLRGEGKPFRSLQANPGYFSPIVPCGRGLGEGATARFLYHPAAIAPASAGGARSSAGEHFLDMEGVTGSIPVAPTTK